MPPLAYVATQTTRAWRFTSLLRFHVMKEWGSMATHLVAGGAHHGRRGNVCVIEERAPASPPSHPPRVRAQSARLTRRTIKQSIKITPSYDSCNGYVGVFETGIFVGFVVCSRVGEPQSQVGRGKSAAVFVRRWSGAVCGQVCADPLGLFLTLVERAVTNKRE